MPRMNRQKIHSLVCLPSDTTFEIYSGCLETEFASDDDDDDEDDNDSTSASASEPSGDHHHHQSVIMNHTDSIGIAKKSVSSEDRVHFIADEPVGTITVEDNPEGLAEPEVRKQLLEYLVQKDGSVVCKWCGEVLPSRSRWYRHKYKLHVQTSASVQQQQHQQPTLAQVGCIQPAPLFKCQSCNAYFKSRKGYIGHLSSRHSGEDVPENDENREEACNAPNKTTASINKTQISHQKKITHIVDWEQQREKEEKLVADIIDRVKRECEAQGETVTRRGYSRRHTTVMNS